MDDRRKMLIISEEAVETCFMLNDHVCQAALDDKCPRSTCSDAFEKAAMKALNDIGERGRINAI